MLQLLYTDEEWVRGGGAFVASTQHVLCAQVCIWGAFAPMGMRVHSTRAVMC